jgi:D-arabinose 5-phosphate isomerase GutQ
MSSHEIIKQAIYGSFEIEKKCLDLQKKDLNLADMMAAVSVLANVKGKIIVSGAGSCSIAARKIVHTFSCLKLPAMYLSPTTALHGSLGAIQSNDVLILLSRSGKSSEFEGFLKYARSVKAFLLTVTENANSPLAKNADLTIIIRVFSESDPGNIFATGSFMVFIAVFDAISCALWHELHYSKDDFADIHPGGGVGEMFAAIKKNKLTT